VQEMLATLAAAKPDNKLAGPQGSLPRLQHGQPLTQRTSIFRPTLGQLWTQLNYRTSICLLFRVFNKNYLKAVSTPSARGYYYPFQ
jgi:hypothetical protein